MCSKNACLEDGIMLTITQQEILFEILTDGASLRSMNIEDRITYLRYYPCSDTVISKIVDYLLEYYLSLQ